MESNGIFSADEVIINGDRGVNVDVREWERKNEGGNSFETYDRGNHNKRMEELGEVIDNEYNGVKVGMGVNDLMTEGAIEADREIQESNRILGSYGSIAVNKLAGRGADPVTDDKVVRELVEDMERGEEEFKQTGDVVGLYDNFDKTRRYYQVGERAKQDSEVEE